MQKHILHTLCLILGVVWGSPRISEHDRQAFLAYTAKYGKNYDTTEEFLMRFDNWKQVDLAIQENHQEFQIGHNKFSDWTPEEKDLVLNKKLGVKLPLDFETLNEQEEFDMSFWDLPDFGGANFTRSLQMQDQEFLNDDDYLDEEESDYTLRSAAPMQCPSGYRWIGDKCKACTGGCAKCTSDTSCRACNSRNFIFDRRRRECNCYTGPYNSETKDCDQCGEGLFWDGDSCESCGLENCNRCKKKGFCTQCNSNFTRRQGKCTCKGFFYTQASSCVICESNQFISAGMCKDCPGNCSTCSSPTGLCLTCLNPSFQIINGKCSCEGSDYFVHEQTKLCTKYVYCGKGYYNDGQNNCLPCKEHCKSCNAVTGYCNICDDPSMELKNDTTISADWHVSWEFQGQEIGQCRCAPKEAFSGGACIPLAVQCPDGAYNDGSNNCVPCPDNCTTCTDFIGFCTSCPDSTFVQEKLVDEGICECPPNQVVGPTESQSCEPQVFCGPGQYNDGHNRCLNCMANCDDCEFITGNCLTCSDTYTLIHPQEQCSCVDGQFLNSNNDCEDIITCPDNFYNDGINNCIRCNSDNCKQCEVDTGICQTCMDTYRYNRDNDTCYCPYPETYWKVSDNLCHDITYPPSGKYNSGANNFVVCPDNCTACHTDLYDFSGECTTCAATFTMNELVSPNKCTCVDKQYKKNGVCTSCADECLLCADNTGSCFKCDYSGYTLQNGVCLCLNGWVVQDDQHCAVKKVCSDGQYNDGHNNCYACQSSANCLKCSAATVCTTCKSTYTLNAKRTNQCDCRTGSQYESGGRCYDLVNCGSYYYNNGYNSCIRCPTNCSYCTSGTYCTGCYGQYTLNYPSTGKCACNWNQYRYRNYDYCYGCGGGSGCGICRDWDGLCVVCKAYWTLYTYNYYCYCWAPSYSSGGNCYPCNEKCWDCSGSTCYSCRSSFTLHYPSSYQCNCLSSQYKASNVYCYSCPSYTYTCHDITANAKTCYDTFEIINNKCACSANKFIGTSVVTGMPACISLTDCPYNQYNRGDNVCLNCPSNSNCLDCELTSGVPKCTQCRATFTYYANEGTYGTCRCNSDEYKTSSNACAKCGTNMITCYDTTGNAKTCDPTFSIINGQCQCRSDQYKSGGQCHDCPTHCTTCSSPTKCLTCTSSYSVIGGLCECNTNTQYYRSSNDTCVTIYDPPTGFYNDGQNNMLACGPNCAKCTSGAAGDCTQCMPTYTMTDGNCACRPYIQFESGNTCVNIQWCGNGFYNDGQNNCGACTTNCSNCLNSATNCTSCESTFTLHYPSFGKCACGEGWYQNQNGQCQQAKTNCSRAEDYTGFCTDCKPTFVYNAATDQCLCPAHTAWNPTEDRCDDCSSGCDTCDSADYCTLCKQTYIFNQPVGSCECNSTALDNNGNGCQALSPCPDGQFNPGDQTCEDCDPGCAKCEILTGRCLQCEVGFNLLAGYCNKWRRLEELVFEGSCHTGCRRCNSDECLQCEKGMVVSLSDKRTCVYPKKCEWPVGPVEELVNLCLDAPFSEDRVVPKFEEDDTLVDWRRWNVIRPAKDQGRCGGDYAFTTASIAESRFAIKTGKLYDLSEQYLLDCDTMSKGCEGGWHESAGYLLSTQGAVLEKDYPFVGKKQECQAELVDNSVFKLNYPGVRQVEANKESFKAALRDGPLQVSFKVSNELFYQYANGVLPSDFCESDKYEGLNHSMFAIGYGTDLVGEYAIVQNEWGSDWGEAGIFRIRLTDDESGPCGLYLNSAYALL